MNTKSFITTSAILCSICAPALDANAQGYAYTGRGTTVRSGVPMAPAYQPRQYPSYPQSTMNHVYRVERNPMWSAARDSASALSHGRQAGVWTGNALAAGAAGNAPAAVGCGVVAGYHGYRAAQSARWANYALQVQQQQACLPLPYGLR